jgi:prepilin peptidase CpaA
LNTVQSFEVPLTICILLVLVVTASYTDLHTRRIPNTITFTGAGFGVLLHSFSDGLPGMLFALAGLAVGIACLLPGYVFGQTGAGDAKLLGAVGTILGPGSTFLAGIASVLAGAILALLVACFAAGKNPWSRYSVMLRHFFATRTMLYLGPDEGERMRKTFPFAPAIAVGSAVGASHYLGLVNWWVLGS